MVPAPLFARGNELLYGESGLLKKRFYLARAGVLPFFVLTAAILWIWLARHDPRAGFLGVTMVVALPSMLANSGLATTDVPFVGAFLVAVYALYRWLEHASWLRSAFLGASVGLAVATKFTAVPFFAATAVAFLLAWLAVDGRWKRIGGELKGRALPLGVAALVAVVAIWGAYRFSVGSLKTTPAASTLGPSTVLTSTVSAAPSGAGSPSVGCPPPPSGTASSTSPRTTSGGMAPSPWEG